LFAVIQSFPLLSPILLSFLLVMLISLAVNPLISRMRALRGGRKSATGLIVGVLVMVIALTGRACFGPMRASVIKLSEQLPAYWERPPPYPTVMPSMTAADDGFPRTPPALFPFSPL
jgi:predicted PurR-regulated permease PerM